MSRASLDAAAALFKQGDYPATEEMCGRLLADGQTSPDVLMLLALALAHQEKFAAAEAHLNVCRHHAPHRNAESSLTAIRQRRDQVQADPSLRNFAVERQVFRDYPRMVAIETVARCNASCTFCPHQELARHNTAMSDQLFAKIVDDLRAIPPGHRFIILPNGVSEPFMDRQIFARLSAINDALPQAAIAFYTNLNVLPRQFFTDIRRVKNLECVNVSFNSADKAEYERVMKIDFDRTVAHLRQLMALNRESGLWRQPLRLSRVADGSAADESFPRRCGELFADFTAGTDYVAFCKRRTNWLGRVAVEQTPIPYALPCSAWVDINVMADGVVPHCCMDAEGRHAIGDVRTTPLLDIYNQPAFRNLRLNATSREGVFPCNTCSLVQ